MTRCPIAGLGLTLVASAVALSAAPAASPPPADKTPPKETTAELIASSDYVAWEEGRVGEQGRLYGNVVFRYKDVTFQTSAVYYKNTESEQTAVSEGPVTITTPELDLRGDRMSLDFKANKAVVTGNVRMRARPKKDEKQTTGKVLKPTEEVTVTCDRVEYFYRIRKANAFGNLTMSQGKRRFTADLAMYFQTPQVLVLDGNVRGTDEKGQPHGARAVKLYLGGRDRYFMEGERYHGVLKLKEGDPETEPAEPPEFPSGPAPETAEASGGSESARPASQEGG